MIESSLESQKCMLYPELNQESFTGKRAALIIRSQEHHLATKWLKLTIVYGWFYGANGVHRVFGPTRCSVDTKGNSKRFDLNSVQDLKK